jgi:hypothetical protein
VATEANSWRFGFFEVDPRRQHPRRRRYRHQDARAIFPHPRVPPRARRRDRHPRTAAQRSLAVRHLRRLRPQPEHGSHEASRRLWGTPLICPSTSRPSPSAAIHLLYRGDGPAADSIDWKLVLKYLANKFGSAGTKIDTCVHNPGRVSRLPGCVNRKGDDRPERPHRIARIISTHRTSRWCHGKRFLLWP